MWILQHADLDEGPIYMAKFDLADGFYRVFLWADDALKLAALLPRYDREPQLIAVPLSLTMGWMNLPPTFCATSKTATDIANASLHQGDALGHCLEAAASAHDTPG
jgi:hypothetical protein